MIDIHTHILPGIDDGARDLEEALEMARLAVADGIRVMVATPHLFKHKSVDLAAINEKRVILEHIDILGIGWRPRGLPWKSFPVATSPCA